jgi:AcrR family transcriptional regulator
MPLSRNATTRRKAKVEPRTLPPERPGPEGGVRAATRRARTEALANGALRLFLERGIAAVSIDDIATRSKVAKATFYTYFSDKSDVLDALLLPVSTRVLAALDLCETSLRDARSPDQLVVAYQTLALTLAVTLQENAAVALLYLQESRAPSVGARSSIANLALEIRTRAVRLTVAAHAHGLLRDIDPRVSAVAVVGSAEAMLFEVLSGRNLGDPLEATETLIDMILRGLSTR